jgi:hypothetical protein
MLLTKKYRIVIKTLPVSHRTDTLHTRAFCSIQTLSSRRSLCATATHHLAHAAHSRRPCNHFASCPGSHNVRNLLIRFRRRGSEEDASVTCRNTGGTLHCPHGAYGQKPPARTNTQARTHTQQRHYRPRRIDTCSRKARGQSTDCESVGAWTTSAMHVRSAAGGGALSS